MKSSRFKPIRLNDRKVDRLLDVFGIPTWDKLDELICSSGDTYGYVYKEAKKEGRSDAEAEDAAEKAELEERDDYYRKWKNASDAAVAGEFQEVGLEIEDDKNGGVKIIPTESWEASADKIKEIINGYGPFYFPSLEEFLSSGPYTAREAVEKHLAWIADRAKVYGDRGAATVYENSMR